MLHYLLKSIKLYGKPKSLPTDNEAVFTSLLFRTALKLLGIKHQRSDKHCPWQNGRIEWFFGTFKERTKQVVFANSQLLAEALPEFRFCPISYKKHHVRTHDHIDQFTPAEKWSGSENKTNKPNWFEAWDGVISGYYFRE